MRSQRVFKALVVAALALVTGCSGSSTTPSGDTYLTWTISGTNYSADAQLIQSTPGVPGYIVINGTKTTGTNTQSLFLTLGFISAKTKYPLGVNPGTTPGGIVGRQLTTSNPGSFSGWNTPLAGDIRDSVTITDISSSKITGAFDCYVEPDGTSGASGAIHIENGKFSVPLNGFVVAAAGDLGSTFTIDSLNGSKFIGATVNGVGTTSAFSFGPLNNPSLTTSTISINVLSVVPAAPGNTYPILTGIKIQVQIGGSSYGGVSGDTGTVTIDSVTGKYVKGHFASVTLSGPSGAITLSGGNFNVKIG